MESLANSEIFFVIAALSLIVVTITLLIILIYIIYILHQARKIVRAVRAEMVNIIDDVEELRVAVKDKAKTVSSLLSVASGMAIMKKLSETMDQSSRQSTKSENKE